MRKILCKALAIAICLLAGGSWMTASAQTQQGIVKTKGRMVPNVARSYNNIGLVYDSQGDNAHAMEYLQKALNIWRKVYRENHPAVATSYHNIGFVYYSQEDYAHALEYFQKALDILIKVFGEEQPDVATSYYNIGAVCYSQGDYAHALEYFQKALDIRIKVYGEGHPKVVKLKELINTVIEEQRGAAIETE